MLNLFTDMGVAHNTLFLGVVCATVDCFWRGQRAAPTPSVATYGHSYVFFGFYDFWPGDGLDVSLSWVCPLTPLSTASASGMAANGSDGCLPHVSSVGPWGSVHFVYWG